MKKWIGLLGIILLLAACATAEEKSVRSLQEIYQDLEQNHDKYTAEDWQRVQVEFEVISAQMKLQHFTDEQLAEIGKLQGKCAVYFTKGYFQRMEKELIQMGGALGGYFEELEKHKIDSAENPMGFFDSYIETISDIFKGNKEKEVK